MQGCRKRGKPVIVATNMLESMITNPTPTRAEVSDIAIAVREGTDAVMLSGETAYGKFPYKSVAVMATVAKRTENAMLTYQVQHAVMPYKMVLHSVVSLFPHSSFVMPLFSFLYKHSTHIKPSVVGQCPTMVCGLC